MADTESTREASETKGRRPAEGAVEVPDARRSSGEAEDAANDAAARRHEMIAVHAYFLAEARAFAGGCELDDWLRAEAEVDAARIATS